MLSVRDEYWLRTPTSKDLFAREGQRAGNKRQNQEIEDKGEGKGGRGICPRGTTDHLWIERKQRRLIGKVQGGNLMLAWGVYFWAGYLGEGFDCWTSKL